MGVSGGHHRVLNATLWHLEGGGNDFRIFLHCAFFLHIFFCLLAQFFLDFPIFFHFILHIL